MTPFAAALLGTLAIVWVTVELCTSMWLLRTGWKELIRLFILLDLACIRLIKRIIRPQYVLRGGCDKRGVCCRHIIGDPPRSMKQRPWLLNLYITFHRVMHRFAVVGRGPNGELVFSCGHLRTDGRCGIYRYRPLICRNYPVIPFFGTPKTLPGCGYVVVPRVVDGMQTRRSLPIVNAHVAVHHPTPPHRGVGELERPEDYHYVEVN